MWIAADETPLPGPVWAQLLGLVIVAIGGILTAWVAARRKDNPEDQVKAMFSFLQKTIADQAAEIVRLNKLVTKQAMDCARCNERLRNVLRGKDD